VTPEEFVAMLRYNAEWPDIGSMNLLTFSNNKAAILAGINVLMDNPKSRKRFRLLAVYARETGERLAEVFGIPNHGPVVVYRSGSRHHGAEGVEGVRQDRGSANLVVAPLDNDPDQPFPLIASSGQYVLMNRDLRRWIVDRKWNGKRHAVSLAHNGLPTNPLRRKGTKQRQETDSRLLVLPPDLLAKLPITRGHR
jgi:hypothetical protein